eukprot:COSAG03_NODE_2408_length_2799_cov_17.383704_4_plen_56_part_00
MTKTFDIIDNVRKIALNVDMLYGGGTSLRLGHRGDLWRETRSLLRWRGLSLWNDW